MIISLRKTINFGLNRVGLESTIARNSTYMLAAETMTRIINLVITKIILFRYLGPEKQGTMNVVISYGLLAAVIAEFGITSAAVRLIARSPREKLGEIMGHASFLRILTTLLMLALLWGSLFTPAGYKFDSSTRMMVIIWGLSISFQALRRNSEMVFQAIEKMKFQATFLVLKAVFSGALILAIVLFKLNLLSIFIALLISDFVDWGVAAYFVRTRVARPRYHIKWEFLRELFILSLPFGLHLLATQVTYYANSYLMDILISGPQSAVRREIGWFSSAYLIVITLMFVPSALATALYPALSRAYRVDKDRMHSLYAFAFNISLLAGPVIALPFFSVRHDILVMMFGAKYGPAGGMLGWVIWALPFGFLASAATLLLSASDRQNYVTYTSILNAAISLAMNYLLVPRLGGRGAALATVITFFLSFALQITPLIFAFPRAFDWKRILMICLYHGVGIATLVLLDSYNPFLRLGLLALYAAGAGLFALRMGKERRRLQRAGVIT